MAQNDLESLSTRSQSPLYNGVQFNFSNSFLALYVSHSYLSPSHIETTTVQIVKNKAGIFPDSNNYRPLTITQKLFESVLLQKCYVHLSTCDSHDHDSGPLFCIILWINPHQMYRDEATPDVAAIG